MLSYLVRRMFKSARPVDRRSVPKLQRLECRLTPVSVPNVLVNDPSMDTGPQFQSETSTIVYQNFQGKEVVLTGFNDLAPSPSANGIGYARSVNGSVFTDLGSLPGSDATSDPFLARDPNYGQFGRIYFASITPGASANVTIFRSDDDGATWVGPVEGMPDSGFGAGNDREWIAVDQIPTNFYPGEPSNPFGTVYVAAYYDIPAERGIYLSHSIDAGDTFQTSKDLSTRAKNQGASIAIAPNHTVHVAWIQRDSTTSNYEIAMRHSTDQGVTFDPPIAPMVQPIVVATIKSNIAGLNNGNLGLGFKTDAFPKFVVNPMNSNYLYGVFADKGDGNDRASIYFVQSDDGGYTWTKNPIKVNDDAGTNDQWAPTIAISPDGKKLVVSFYDRRIDPCNNLVDYWAAPAGISLDSLDPNYGKVVAFLPNQRISKVSFRPPLGGDDVGDYDVVNAGNNNFYFAWGDNRDAVPEIGQGSNVYFAKTSFTDLTKVGPEVVSVSPTGDTVLNSVSTIDVVFNQGMNTTTFNLNNDVFSFTGPNPNSPPSVTGSKWIDNRHLQLSFTAQSDEGNYQLILQPSMKSADSVPLDDNLDGKADSSTGSQIVISFRMIKPEINNTSDVDNGNFGPGELTLREALRLAEGDPGQPTITFNSTVFGSAVTITLNHGELKVRNNLTIIGPTTTPLLTINAQSKGRVFNIGPCAVTIQNMILINGYGQEQGGTGGAILNNGGTVALTNLNINNCTASLDGGAIYTLGGSLTVNQCTLDANRADASQGCGGAIAVFGSASVTVKNSTISNNTATLRGGGIFIGSSGTVILSTNTINLNSAPMGGGICIGDGSVTVNAKVTVSACSIESNKATGLATAGRGGGGITIDQAPYVIVKNSTINANEANGPGLGGGILFAHGVTHDTTTYNIQNCTIYGNTADRGGGIFVNPNKDKVTNMSDGKSVMRVYNSTIASNTATHEGVGTSNIYDGGGIGFLDFVFGDTVYLSSTIVATNKTTNTQPDAGPDIGGAPVSGFKNVVASKCLIGNDTNGFANPDLNLCLNGSPGFVSDTSGVPILANYGGPTKTVALAFTSQCIDTGENLLGLRSEQRDGDNNTKTVYYPRVNGLYADMGAFESDYDEIY